MPNSTTPTPTSAFTPLLSQTVRAVVSISRFLDCPGLMLKACFRLVNEFKTLFVLLYVLVQMTVDIISTLQTVSDYNSIPDKNCSLYFDDKGAIKEPIKIYNYLQWFSLAITSFVYMRKCQQRYNIFLYLCGSSENQDSLSHYTWDLCRLNALTSFIVNIFLGYFMYDRLRFKVGEFIGSTQSIETSCQDSGGQPDPSLENCQKILCNFLLSNVQVDMLLTCSSALVKVIIGCMVVCASLARQSTVVTLCPV